MIPSFVDGTNLPRGRYSCSLEEFEERFVHEESFSGSDTRKAVWDDFTTLLRLIHRLRVRVPSVFVGGSFVTGKADPSDIDVSVLYDASAIRLPSTLTELSKTVRNTKKKGLRIDAFTIPWDAQPEQARQTDSYLCARGKWDDWWMRDVPKSERGMNLRNHSFPNRGYVEVEVDGYK